MKANLHEHTYTELSALISSGDLSAKELFQYFEARIQAHTSLNAFISTTFEQAENSTLPVAYKDNICTLGEKMTCGSKMLSNFTSPYDATLVRNLKAQGFASLGKLNMDEFAMGSSNETSFYGPCLNPWDRHRVPGGSSGGAAAAVAARLVPGAIGSDTGGSVRQPAAFCGVTGLKPTYGRISRYGMTAFASSLDQAGPLATSAQDCAYLLQHMAGHDPLDTTSADRAVDDYVGKTTADFQKLTVGIPSYLNGLTMDADVQAALDRVKDQLISLGAQVVEIDIDMSESCIPVYYIIAPCEAASNLARFDGVHYGVRAPAFTDIEDMITQSRSQGFGMEVKRRILTGTYCLSSGYYDAYYIKALKCRQLITDSYLKALTQCDVILTPTTPTTAFKLDTFHDDPVAMYANDILTIPANLAGLPAISAPAGFDGRGLPIGFQLIGRPFEEATILNTVHHYQQHTDHHLKSPALGDAS